MLAKPSTLPAAPALLPMGRALLCGARAILPVARRNVIRATVAAALGGLFTACLSPHRVVELANRVRACF